MSGGQVLEAIVTDIESLGYKASVYVLNAVDFGVPQKRKRVFIMGGDCGKQIDAPLPTHFDTLHQSSQLDALSDHPKNKWLTVKDAISDLAEIEPLLPKDTHVDLNYLSDINYSPYQQRMKLDSDVISHHSVKQMLGIRRLRLAMMHPGDYGKNISNRIADKGLPYELIDKLLSGSAGIRDYKGCRKQDVEKELKLREMLHQGGRNIDEIMNTLGAGGFANKYRRLDWHAPSHTLVAHMARDCSDFVHPEQDRFISVREAARLQSFQDSYRFHGSQFQQFKQIGNAVPPELGSAIARQIKNALTEQASKDAA